MNVSTTADLDRLWYTVGSPLDALLLGDSPNTPQPTKIHDQNGTHDGIALLKPDGAVHALELSVWYSNRWHVEGLRDCGNAHGIFVLLLAVAGNSLHRPDFPQPPV